MENTKITKKSGSVVEIEGEIPYEELKKHKDSALKKLGVNMELPGFRKGNIPPTIIEKNIGEMPILQEMAEMTLAEHYPKIIFENKINVIGRPDIVITKLATENPLGFKIQTSVLPEIKLPDYKALAAESNKLHKKPRPATEKEIDETILDIRRRSLVSEKQQSGEKDASLSDVKDADLPKLDDEQVKKFGDFKDVDDLTSRTKESMNAERELRGKENYQIELIEKIIDKTNIDVPQVFIDSEIEKTIAQLRHNIERMGGKFDDYLKHLKKTEGSLREELVPDATKHAKMHLIVQEIAKKEDIKPDDKDIAKEIIAIKKQHPEANEEVVKILESQQG